MTKIKKTPAMPMYGKDAYDDERFRALSYAAQGVYWRLAWWQWAEGDIPESLTEILNGLPRKHASEVKRVWKEIAPFFPPIGDGRRRSLSVEKRRPNRTPENEVVEKSDTSSSPTEEKSTYVCARAANAIANATAKSVVEGDAGEPKILNFAHAPAIVARLAEIGLRPPPPEQVTASWLRDYGEDLINETVREVTARGGGLTGKHWKYLQTILANRTAKPNERPRPKPVQPSARDFGMRTIADLAAKRKV